MCVQACSFSFQAFLLHAQEGMWLLLELWLLLFPSKIFTGFCYLRQLNLLIPLLFSLAVGRQVFQALTLIFWFVCTCETKFWKSTGFLCKCWLSAWVHGDMGFCIQQNCFLLPLSKAFSCTGVSWPLIWPQLSLCLISPGKELHSQLPSAKNATSMNVSFQWGKVSGQLSSFY